MAAAAQASDSTPAGPKQHISWRQAAFIGVAAMVGAGIFSLLGAAGEVAGSAVWVSFVLAGIIAGLQGYSFARLGARYPSAAGLLEYVRRGYGDGHFMGTIAWLVYWVNMIVTAMVAVSFGSYASALFTGDNEVWAKVFAALIIVVMAGANIVGATFVARAQSIIVVIVIGSLTLFAVVTLANIDPSLLAPHTYPTFRQIFSSVALTFFAFLGFGIVTFTAKDLRQPDRELPKAIYLALALATAIYVAVSLGVFGTLTVTEVIASGGTALAVAAQPVLGQAGYWLMGVTGLFATAGATNGGLYPAVGLTEQLAETRQFPPLMGRRLRGRYPFGLVLTAAVAATMALGFSLTAIASIGSAVALLVFMLVTIGHLRVRHETGAATFVLWLGILTTGLAFLVFAVTTLVQEPASMVMLLAVIVLSAGLDWGWKRRRDDAGSAVTA
ncbi:MAG TPA: APC family permease [Candidatus Nanopelagicales bacterium]|jgi:amino acid transporter|nr:APC family permease [Candidatus Nanopelagicales bacterium]